MAVPAQAAFPGANGKIAFTEGGGINVVNPDGSGRTQIFADPYAQRPSWSPDGTKIVFSSKRNDPNPGGCSPCNYELYVIDADGSDLYRLTNDPGVDSTPSWSPDGSKLAFVRGKHVWMIEADGTGASAVTTSPTTGTPSGQSWAATASPAWSPDGTEIAFSGHFESSTPAGVFAITPDGTGLRYLALGDTGDSPDWAPDASQLVVALYSNDHPFLSELRTILRYGASTNLDRHAIAPVSSPDGTRLLVDGDNGGFVTLNPDGSDPQTVPNSGYSYPDWQPIPINAYPRPLFAGPVQVTLAIAYEPCTAPNRTHGPPLDSPSCAPPAQSSSQLTVGTFDANGRTPGGTGQVIASPLAGDPTTPADEADVYLRAKATDVRLASDLSDYAGALEARMTLRITDKDNTPSPGGPGAATVTDMPFSFSVPCSPTADTGVGSSCFVETTADTLVPGTVKEKRRAVWQVGQVALDDGEGNAFMRQGLFVP